MIFSKKFSYAIFWTFIEQLTRRGVQTAALLMLTWFITPAEFGVVAIASVFITLANSLMESGARQALIRAKTVNETDYGTIGKLTLLLSVLCFFFMVIAAPIVADYYQNPQLVNILRVISVVVILSSLQIIPLVRMSRELEFKKQFTASIPANIASFFVAIVLAYFGAGVWSLVAQTIINTFINTFVLCQHASWQFGKGFSLASAKKIYSYGIQLFSAGLIDLISRSTLLLCYGKLIEPGPLGYYFIANKIQETISSQITSVFHKVSFPALSSVRDNKKSLSDSAEETLSLIAYIVFPVLSFLTAFSEYLFEIFFSHSWQGASEIFALIAFSGMMQPLYSNNLQMLKILGKGRVLIKLEIIRASMTICVILAAYYGDMELSLQLSVVMSVISYLAAARENGKDLCFGPRLQLIKILPYLAISLSLAYTLRHSLSLLKVSETMVFLIGAVAYVILYLCVCRGAGLQGQKTIGKMMKDLRKV